MNIGIFVDELFTGGFQKVALEEAIEFSKSGHKVTFYVLRRNETSEYENILIQHKIKLLYLSERLPRLFRFNFKFPFFTFFSFFHITYSFLLPFYFHDDLDLIISHGTYTSLSCISISNKKKIKLINFVHDPAEYILRQKYNKNIFQKSIASILSNFGNLLDSYIIKNSFCIVAFPDMVKFMQNNHNIKTKYVNIQNGVELGTISNKMPYAVASTKWDSGKNVDFLITIWENVGNKIPLYIIGKWVDENEKNKYVDLIKCKNLDDILFIKGSLKSDDMGKYYRDAYFLIHPCREAFGLTILEAAAQGTVAVFTSNSGVAQLFNKENSFQVGENSIEEYVNTIQKIVTDEKSCINMGMAAYEVAKKNSWELHNSILLESLK